MTCWSLRAQVRGVSLDVCGGGGFRKRHSHGMCWAVGLVWANDLLVTRSTDAHDSGQFPGLFCELTATQVTHGRSKTCKYVPYVTQPTHHPHVHVQCIVCMLLTLSPSTCRYQ
jgi:hypothetical protein